MTKTTKRRCVRLELPASDGKRIRKYFYATTLKEAREKRDAYKRASADGMDILSSKEPAAKWIARWLDIYGEKGGWSTQEMRRSMSAKVSSAIGTLPISAVRQIHIQKIANAYAGMSYSYVHKLRGVTQAIFRAALANRIIAFDPTAEVTWKHATKGTHRFLSKEEIGAITTGWQQSPAGLWALIMMYAGLRPGELLGLRWADIDWETNVIHVRRAAHFEGNSAVLDTTKTEAGVRDVPMFPVLRRALKGVLPTHDLVATHNHRMVTKAGWRADWKALTDTLGLQMQAQDLRHTFCSLLYEAGVDVKTAQKLMGHASPEITMKVYTHLAEELESTALDKMAAFTENLAATYGV